MTQVLKQATAVDVLIGPFVDSGDGYTAEEALSPSVLLSKNGQALGAANDGDTAHDDAGYYNCELDATDTDTVGTLILIVEGSSTHLPVRHEFQVVEENVYDAIYGASAALGTDVASILADTNELQSDDIPGLIGTPSDFGSGTSTLAANLSDLADNGTASYDRSTDSLQALRDHVGDGTNLTEAGGDGDHLTEAGGDGDHLTEAGGDGDHLTEAGGDGDHLTESGGTGDQLTALATAASITALNDPTAAAIADAVLQESIDAHKGTAASLAEHIDAIQIAAAAIKAVTDNLPNSGALSTIDGIVDAIKAKTDSLTFTVANEVDANVQSLNDQAMTGDGSSGDKWGPA